jgi:hypothetical protein
MRARYYEPTSGRFVREDPAKSGLNWFAYAEGNPILKVDPDGKSPIPGVLAWWFVVTSAVIGSCAGFLVGFQFAVGIIQQDDPTFNPRLETALIGAFGAGSLMGIGGVLGRTGATWGSGIGLAKLAPRLGIAAAIGFLIGFELGMIAASLLEIEHQESKH